MIIKILEKPSASLRNILEYNEKEIGEEKLGELISTNVFGDTAEERFREFVSYIDQEKTNPILHIPIRLAKGENLTNEEFDDLAHKYMDGMGFGHDKFPYQLIRHHDIEDGEHVHLVVSRSAFNGDYYNEFQYRKKSSIIRQDLEKEYSLTELQSNKVKRDTSLNEINMFLFNGQKTNKDFLKESLKTILDSNTQNKKIRIDDFVKALNEKEIYPIFNLQKEGEKISGISFHVDSPYGSNTFKGSQVNNNWSSISKYLDVIPEDKHYLNEINADSMSVSLNKTEALKDEDKKMMHDLSVVLLKRGVDETKVESLLDIKLDSKLRKSIGTFIKQSDKGRNVYSPDVYANQLMELKLSKQEYALFHWEKSREIKDSKTHARAFMFLRDNNGSKDAFSWVLRFPPQVTNIDFKQYTEAFKYNQERSNFKHIILSQVKDKEYICKQLNISGREKEKFLNTPMTGKEFNSLKTMIGEKGSANEVRGWIEKSVNEYSSYLKIKVGQICSNSGASPHTAKLMYNKFLVELEKSSLNHNSLGRMYGLTKNKKPSQILTSNLDGIFNMKSKTMSNSWGGGRFLENFMATIGSLHKCSEESREGEDVVKRKRRRIDNN